jgi:WD40 repeat protein
MTIKQYNAETIRAATTTLKGHSGEALAVSFSPDSQLFSYASSNLTISGMQEH